MPENIQKKCMKKRKMKIYSAFKIEFYYIY